MADFEDDFVPDDGSDFSLSDDDFEAEVDDDDDDFEEPVKAAPKKATPKKKKKATPTKASDGETAKKATGAKRARATPKSDKGSKAKAPSAKKAKAAAGGGGSAADAAGGELAKGAIKEKDAGPVLVAYITKQNRPYSSINIFDNLHGAVKKAHVTRVLDKLAAEEKIICKAWGKTKVYWPDQAQYGEISKEMLSGLTAERKALLEQQGAATAAAKAAQGATAALAAEPTDVELGQLLQKEEEEIAALEQRLASIRQATGDQPAVTEAARDKALNDMKRYKKAWSDRKNKTMDFVDAMCEGMGIKRRAVFDKIGIETDAQYGITCRPRDF